MKLVGEVGNWKIVAHIAFKFYSVASETFSTGSTMEVNRPLAAGAGSNAWADNSSFDDFIIANLMLSHQCIAGGLNHANHGSSRE